MTNRDAGQSEAVVLPAFARSIAEWAEGATGDWARDNAIGRERANALRANIQMTGNHPVLGRLIMMISENGHFGGIEAGFFQRVSELMSR